MFVRIIVLDVERRKDALLAVVGTADKYRHGTGGKTEG